jgi:4-hydroxy-tetrahydrodipicolinate synthase
VNLNAAAIRAVYDGMTEGRDMTAEDAAIKDFRAKVQKAGLIGGMKALMAVTSGDRRWLALAPPHLNATMAEGEALRAELGAAAAHLVRS